MNKLKPVNDKIVVKTKSKQEIRKAKSLMEVISTLYKL